MQHFRMELTELTWILNRYRRMSEIITFSVRELLRCADTGVGIGTALDGVITFENGAAYKTAPDGEVTVMRPEDSMAFAAAMVFDENAPEIALNGIDDLTSLKQMLAPFCCLS